MSLSSANGKDPSIRDKKEPPLFKSAAALTKRTGRTQAAKLLDELSLASSDTTKLH
jgi:hypothetical protein